MSKKKVTIIDADSIIYIIAYSFKDAIKVTSGTKIRLNASIDQFVTRILKATNADEYLGYFGKPGGKPCFRYERAETRPYKDTRKEKEDWFLMYRPLIIERFEKEWNFEGVEGYEADDYVCQAACKFRDAGEDVTVAAVDKDILQVRGVAHWPYTPNGNKNKEITRPSDQEAYYSLYYLILAGDVSDGYAGIPGIGKTKTNEILKDCETEEEFEKATKDAYKYWFTEGLIQKEIDKILKDQYKAWKEQNPGSRLTKKVKEEIYSDFEEVFEEMKEYANDVDSDEPNWERRYSEMFDLAKLPDTGDYREGIIITSTIRNKFKTKTSTSPSSIKDMLDSIT